MKKARNIFVKNFILKLRCQELLVAALKFLNVLSKRYYQRERLRLELQRIGRNIAAAREGIKPTSKPGYLCK